MKSGCLKIYVSSWMYDLSIYFQCILIFADVSYRADVYCGSLKDAWQTTGSYGSDNRGCVSSKVYGLSWKEMRVDD